MKSIGTFTRVMFMSHILQEKYRIRSLKLRKWNFGVLDFFTTENVGDGVTTYLWERDVAVDLVHCRNASVDSLAPTRCSTDAH